MNYYGIQAGNQQTFSVHYHNGADNQGNMTIAEDSAFSPLAYKVTQTVGSQVSMNWVQELSDGLGIKKIQNPQQTIIFSSPLLSLKNPITPGFNWTSSSAISGTDVGASLTAKVSAGVLVQVPAGYFQAFPIHYTMKLTEGSRHASSSWTEYFVPYIGTIKSTSSSSTMQVNGFGIAAGTVSTLPPVVTGRTPSAASPGTQVTIRGYQFGATQGKSRVVIGGVGADTIISWSDQEITCIVPTGVSSGSIVIFTDTWTSNGNIGIKIKSK